MQISDAEVRRILASREVVKEIEDLEQGIDDPIYATDPALIEAVTQHVQEMGDREDRIAELKAKIASGQYNPTGEEIAGAMIRRAIADQVR